jgi:small subunit ribosomal protein S6
MAETTTTTDNKTSQYEAMFLLPPAATQENNGGIDLVRSTIERHGGKILVCKKWDERKLSYEINKQKRGTYIVAYFTAPGGAVAPLEREVKLSDDFLRVLVTKADHLNQQEMEAVEPQPIIRVEERPSWDDRPPRRDYGDRGPRRDDRGGGDGDRGGDRGPRGPRREENAPAAAEAGAGKD